MGVQAIPDDTLDALIDRAEAAFARAIRRACRAATEHLVRSAKFAAPLNLDDAAVASQVWRAEVPKLMDHIARSYRQSALGVVEALNDSVTAAAVPVPFPASTGVALSLAPDEFGHAAAFVDPRLALDTAARSYLQTVENRMVNVGDYAWSNIRSGIAEGFALGESIPKITRRIREAAAMSTRRARTVARTEVVSASNAGAMAGASAIPELQPETKTWLATSDARTRPSHQAADGQTVLFDEAFSVGGASMQRPGDGPAAEVVNCRCTVLFGDALDIPEPEPVPAWTAPVFPGTVNDLRRAADQPRLPGAHEKFILEGSDGSKYLFKPMESWQAHGEMIASQITERAGLRAPRVWNVDYNGRSGSLQEFLPNSRNAFPGSSHDFNPLLVDRADLNILQQNRAVDWMIGNNDAHGAQFIRQSGGGGAKGGARVIGIDKGQAFKYFDSDRLDYTYHPNSVYGEASPVYNRIEEAYANNTLGDGVFLRPNSPKLKPTIDRLMGIADDEYRAMLAPYAEGRYGVGQAAETFIRAAIDRKNSLRADLTSYHSRLYRARSKLRTPQAHPPTSIGGGVGGPQGFEGAINSQNTLSWAERNDSPHTHASAAPGIRQYTGSGYRPINQYLRGEELSYSMTAERAAQDAARIRSELGAAKTDFYVQRQLSIKLPNGYGGDVGVLQGAVLHDRAFMSTATIGRRSWSGDAFMKIKVNKGTPASWVDNISANSGEREIVLGDDQYLYVHHASTRINDHGVSETYIEAEVVSREWAESAGMRIWDTNKGVWR